MDISEKYFIKLISAHLNGAEPPYAPDGVDFDALYALSTEHGVAAIIGSEVSSLKNGALPQAKAASAFKQQVGYAVIDAAERERLMSFVREKFSAAGIDFIFVKGAVLRELYPAPELRTGSDTDIVIRNASLSDCKALFEREGLQTKDDGSSAFSAYMGNQHIEIHGELDCDNDYFKNIFALCTAVNGGEYALPPEEHLLYVLCHAAKHFKNCGAGIKMFMDADVLIRAFGAPKSSFYDKCKAAGIFTFAKTSLALCAKWFGTPVDAEFDLSRKLIDTLGEEVIRSGNFGFSARGMGGHYIAMGAGGSSKTGAKLKALRHMIFLPARELKLRYGWVERRPYLIGAAWLVRLFKAVFLHFNKSRRTIDEIARSGAEDIQYGELLRELEII